MILYLTIIAIAVAIVSTIVAFSMSLKFLSVLGFTALAVVIVVAIDGLTAGLCRLLPKRCVIDEKSFYKVSAKEKKFYEKIKIRKWKDKVPEIGQFTGFRKNKLEDPKSVEYIDRFLMEINYGELGHFVSMFTSFLLLLFFPVYHAWFAIAIPVAIVSMLMNIPSFMILRYTSYKLRVLKGSMLKKLRREAQAAEFAREVAATE